MAMWSRVVLAGCALIPICHGSTCVTEGSACEYSQANTVFIGKVIASSEFSATFEVTEALRGVQAGRVDVSSSTGSFFEVGSDYLVYASYANDSLHTEPCDGSKRLGDAKQDLQYIRHFGRKFSLGRPLPGYVSGRVANRELDLNPGEASSWPVRGVAVRARHRNGRESRTVTDNTNFLTFPRARTTLLWTVRGATRRNELRSWMLGRFLHARFIPQYESLGAEWPHFRVRRRTE
jgi:hypothetical protein